MIVGKMIKEIRENAGLSQEQFAQKLAISRQAVSKWERGVALPDIENIMYISDLFNVSLDKIVKGDIEMETKIISDNRKSKLFFRLFIGILVSIAAIFSYIHLMGGIVFQIFDLRAMILILFFPLLFQYIMYGKFTFTAFSIISKDINDNILRKKIQNFFSNYAIVLWLTSLLILVINFIIMLRFLENRDELGPNLFFMANVVLTSGLINMIVIVPYKIKIQKYIGEKNF